jgi:O-acetyl-ADP-ribose deacetylase (regulator of RNase III)
MTQASNTVEVVVGDMFEAPTQTLVNTVNCVGVMGKGVALEFKKRFPAMYEDYVERCERNEVKLGRPYLYRNPEPPHVLNFPTKGHWRSVARLKDIVAGLEYLEAHYRDWGITSLAVPPLGCGQGALDWHTVGPTLYERLSRLEIPVALYAPFDTPHAELTPKYLQRTLASNSSSDDVPHERRLQPGWVALAAALADLQSDPHHWPIGKVSFQKLAYFLTAAGVPTGLDFQRSTYGPYAADLTRVISTLVNNDLLEESQLGRMIELKVGDTFRAASVAYESNLDAWHEPIHRAADLLARMQTREAEVAATVHLVASEIADATGEPPTDEAILTEVMEWKRRKKPALREDEVLNTIHSLAMLGWLEVSHSEHMRIDEAALVGF